MNLNAPSRPTSLEELERLWSVLVDLESHPCITDDQRTDLIAELNFIAQHISDLRRAAEIGYDA
jgi:hypothetical protein